MAVATVEIQVNSQGAVRNLNQVSAASKATASAVDGVKNAVTGLVGAFTVVSTLKFVFAKTAELESQTKSLEVLTGSVTKARSIIQKLQQLGAVTPFTSTELIDTAKRLNAFGVSGEKVVETTRRLADVAGATGAELQGLATAYGQVQAKGRLQSEELLQFQERGVALSGELRKMYGLSGEELQKALSKGRISAEAVEVALKRLTDAGGKYANGAVAQSETLQGKLSTLQDSVDELARVVGQKLAPALSSFIDNTIGVVKAITDLPDPVKNATGELVKFGLQFLVVKKAIEAVIAIRAAYIGALAAITVATAASGTSATTSASAFALYTTNVKTLQAASIATAGSVSGLSAALLGLAGIGIVTVGINYVITQTGAVLGSADAAQKSLAARSQQSLAGQLKGKTVEERQKMLKITQKNLANDRKLASTLALQIRAQDARAESAPEMAAPADRAKLIELQARVKTNQARIKAITSIPLDKPKNPELPPTPALLSETGGGEKDKKKKEKKERESELAQIQAANGLFISQELIKARIAKAEYDQNQLEVMRLQMVDRGVKLLAEAATIQREKIPQDEKDAKMLGINNQLKASELQYQRDIAQNIKQQQEPLNAIILANKTKLEDDKAYQRLIAEGINPEIAKQYVEIDRAGKALQKSLEPAVALAKAALAEAEARGLSADQVERLKKKLEDLQKMPEEMVAEARGTVAPAAKPQSFKESITGERDKIKNELDELTKASNLVAFGAKAIGDSFATSFKGIVSGAMGAKEALASFFKGIADAFLDMAAQIIAKWITMTILNSVLALFPGGGGGGGGGKAGGGKAGGGSGLSVPNVFGPTSATITGFAEGGYVTGPTNAVIGEGGESEYVIPASKMNQAMSNYSAGKRGASILGDSTGMGDSSMGESTGAFTLETVVINNIEYATVDQVRAMSNAAAKQGAEGGFSKSMSSLRNSRSQRSRLGMR